MPRCSTSLPLIALLVATTCPEAAAHERPISLTTNLSHHQWADTTIETPKHYTALEWSPSDAFAPPYTICQTTGTDTIFRAETRTTRFTIEMPTEGSSHVSIRSAAGAGLGVELRHSRGASPWVAAWIAVALVGLAAAGLAVFGVRQRRKLKTVRREVEEAKTRHTKKYECATVLFSDIEGFTKIAAHLNPEQLVDELDRYFIYFDELVDRFGVEKIKTIGDAYMCAGGVPDNDSANPIEVTLVGLGMIAYVNERHAERKNFWNMRVGINTGPVVSGHIGNIKKVFDIWGDTVNTASRMESGGEPGRVNVSDSTYEKIRDYFDCEYRGKMPVKYKGEIDMYFVNGLKPEYCQPGAPHKPNALMLRKIQVLRTHDFEQMVRETTLNGAHPNLVARFNSFLARVATLCAMEQMTDDEEATCTVAAIFSFVKVNFPHDTSLWNESASDELMRKMHLSDQAREAIRRVATHATAGKSPEDRMEEVLADAGNEVFGRKDMIQCLVRLHEELTARGIESRSMSKWLSKQKQALEAMTFHTDSARKLCEVAKPKQIEILDRAIAL